MIVKQFYKAIRFGRTKYLTRSDLNSGIDFAPYKKWGEIMVLI